MTDGKTGQRLRILAGLVVFMFAALTARLWFLQVLAVDEARREAEANGVRLVPEPAPRGRILDRRGRELVTNRMSLVVTLDRSKVPPEDIESLLFDLAGVLELDVRELVERYHDQRYLPFTPVPLAVDVPPEQAFLIAEHPERFQGVEVVGQSVRDYPAEELLADEDGGLVPYPGDKLAAHLLGYIGEVSADQLESGEFADYEPGDEIGQTGVELQYEHDLRGADGFRKLHVNAQGQVIREIGRTAPEPGDDVVLSIDAEIQALVEESLHLGIQKAQAQPFRLPAVAGAAIVMDPDTGQVLAMASYPSYRPDLFLGRVTRFQLARLQGEEANNPLFNRVIAGEYNPASTFKPFMALAALRDGIELGGRPFAPGGFYPCPSVYEVPTDFLHTQFRNWKPTDGSYISIPRALAESCDTTFYPMGFEYWKRWRDFGREPLQRHLRRAGFGKPTLIDIPYEHDGVVPTAEWKATLHEANPKAYPEGRWFPGDMVNMSIGAGDLLVTPLQMATAYSAIANGGTVYAPRVALRIQSPDGEVIRKLGSRVVDRVPFSAAHLGYVREALTGVVKGDGTAAFAFRDFPLEQVPVAGKTGTADAKVSGREDHSWFAAMAPADDPDYVVVVIVEQAGFGSVTAAPVVRRIIEGLFGLPLSDFSLGAAAD